MPEVGIITNRLLKRGYCSVEHVVQKVHKKPVTALLPAVSKFLLVESSPLKAGIQYSQDNIQMLKSLPEAASQSMSWMQEPRDPTIRAAITTCNVRPYGSNIPAQRTTNIAQAPYAQATAALRSNLISR